MNILAIGAHPDDMEFLCGGWPVPFDGPLPKARARKGNSSSASGARNRPGRMLSRYTWNCPPRPLTAQKEPCGEPTGFSGTLAQSPTPRFRCPSAWGPVSPGRPCTAPGAASPNRRSMSGSGPPRSGMRTALKASRPSRPLRGPGPGSPAGPHPPFRQHLAGARPPDRQAALHRLGGRLLFPQRGGCGIYPGPLSTWLSGRNFRFSN